MKNFEHSVCALLFMAIIGLLTGNWLAGALFASGYYLGREMAQAEYRNILYNYGGKRVNMPWWGAFQARAWDRKSMLDWILPTIVTISIAILSSFWG